MITWELQPRKIKELTPYHKNPRYLKDKDFCQLQTSLDKFGLIDKPIINLDNTIIGGHQRIALLKRTEVRIVICWVPSRLLDDKEVEELNIRLNKNQGDWDFDILGNQWEADRLIEYGFTPEELHIDMDMLIKPSMEEGKPGKKKKSCPNCGHEF